MFRLFILGALFTSACASEPDYISLDDLGERPALGKADQPVQCAGMSDSLASAAGLPGSYVAPPQIDDGLRSITFGALGEHGEGMYSGFRKRDGIYSYELGVFRVSEDNPLTGASLVLAPGQNLSAFAGFTEGYWILGSRILQGRVQQLCIWKGADAFSSGPWVPFALQRVGL